MRYWIHSDLGGEGECLGADLPFAGLPLLSELSEEWEADDEELELELEAELEDSSVALLPVPAEEGLLLVCPAARPDFNIGLDSPASTLLLVSSLCKHWKPITT